MHSTKLSGRPRSSVARVWHFEAIGTQWYIRATLTSELKQIIRKRIRAFDAVYSRFRSDSMVSRIAAKPGAYTMPDDGVKLMNFYHDLYRVTDGLCTPLIGRTLEQAGYDAEYSLQPKQLTPPPTWEDSLEFSPSVLTTKQPVVLDFGAAGKGYLVDIIGSILDAHGISGYVINAGGDILVKGGLHALLLESPDDTSVALGQVEINDGALCGSSGNRRAWGEFTHILHPRLLLSPIHIQAVWVQAKSCMLADGIATALFFVSPQDLQTEFDFSYVIIRNGNLEYSDNFNVEWYT